MAVFKNAQWAEPLAHVIVFGLKC